MQTQSLETQNLRQTVEQLIHLGDASGTYALLKQLWQDQPTPATARYILSKAKQIVDRLSLIKCRVAFLRSFTIEPALPLLQAAAFVQGMDVAVYLSDFNTYAQDILNPSSPLYEFQPDVVFLAVQTRDIAPDLWHQFTGLTGQEKQEAIEQAQQSFSHLIQAFQKQSTAHLAVHTLEQPPLPSQGILDLQQEHSQIQAIATLNQYLYQTARQQPGLHLLDYDGLISRYGRMRWYDESKWLTMRMPIAADALIHLANEWSRFLQPLTGRSCKCLVVDLDNTLWGGVIGEDGMAGIKLSGEYPGAVFRQFQQAILDLYQRGIILAICSKNNEAEALEVLRHHGEMVLRPEHFAALRINWLDKAENLRDIAAQLNIGIEALAFVDDNPTEREWIKQQLPEVTVIDLPANPLGYVEALRRSPVFERVSLSAEDQQRGQYYAQQRQRQDLQQGATSLEEFYASLQMQLEVIAVDETTLARTAQLTQKTNQFNLTTKRRSEPEIAELLADPNWRITAYRLRDRFGDNGIIAVVLQQQTGDTVEIDTFLMSCRVIGRTVETAILSLVMQQAAATGAKQVRGWYVPTKKNAPAQDFYAKHGFKALKHTGDAVLWSKDLDTQAIDCPVWIEVRKIDQEA